MRYRFCPHCGMRYVSSIGGNCPHCGEALDASTEAQTPAAEPQPASPEQPAPQPPRAQPVREPPPPEAPAGVEPVEPVIEEPVPAPEVQAAGAPLEDDQVRCPHCGEALYRGEQVCWNCGRRVQTGEEVVEVVPESGAALPAEDRGWQDELPADYQAPPPQEAMTTAYWALGLGLASVLTCGVFAFLGPFALWLGIRATREGAGPIAVAGLVLGALGTLMLGVWVAWLALVITRMGAELSWGVGSVIAAGLPLPEARALREVISA
jgi:uncharacterized Zn finger protein (UPF0148 family)